MDNKYCYPNTDAFKNKFDIKDKNLLAVYERKFSTARMSQLSQNPIKGNFDYSHLKKIHNYVFQDLFSWAGQQRTINISKTNSFCDVKYIESYINELFDKLEKENYMIDKPFDYKIKRLSYYFSEINATHPFREGNGRTQREFIKSLGNVLGVDIQFRTVTAETMIKASIHSFNIDNSLLDKMFFEISKELPFKQQIDRINKICLKDGDFLNNRTVKEFISFKINENTFNINKDILGDINYVLDNKNIGTDKFKKIVKNFEDNNININKLDILKNNLEESIKKYEKIINDYYKDKNGKNIDNSERSVYMSLAERELKENMNIFNKISFLSGTNKSFYENIDEYERTTLEKKALMERAYGIAEIAHFGQTRDEGTPYIEHPKNVYKITKEITGGANETSCIYSLLHDVLEDCVFVNESYLKNCFGDIVLNDIKLLTKKKGEDIETYLTKISEDEFVSFIKVCDRIDNIRSLKNTNKDKRERYLKQTTNIFIPIFEKVINSDYVPLTRAIELLKKEVQYYE